MAMYSLEVEARAHWKDAQRYQLGWELGRTTLYNLCADTRHNDPAATVSKLWLIGRSHSAALERTHQTDKRWRTERYWRAAKALRKLRLDQRLDRIRDSGAAYDEPQLAEICLAVETVSTTLEGIVGQRKLSLASKYLHFHTPIIPILDRNSYNTFSWLAPRRRKRGETKYQGHIRRFLAVRDGLLKAGYRSADARTIDNFAMYWWSD